MTMKLIDPTTKDEFESELHYSFDKIGNDTLFILISHRIDNALYTESPKLYHKDVNGAIIQKSGKIHHLTDSDISERIREHWNFMTVPKSRKKQFEKLEIYSSYSIKIV